MKRNQLIGTMCAILGLLCATGETIVNGILAVVFLWIAAYLLRDFAQGASSGIEQEEDKDNYAQAA